MQEQATMLREAWLEQAVAFLVEHMVQHGLAPVTVRVSCGWPSRGGMSAKRTVIGQCFEPAVSADGISQIFISPLLDESIEVLGTLLHEVLHASVGVHHGHQKPFSQAARKVGLDGPPTATVVGASLRPILQRYVDQVGPYPHARLRPVVKEKPGSRLRLYQCACEEPIKVRVARDDFQAQCLLCDAMFTQVNREGGV